MGPKWDFDTFAPSIHMGPEWKNPEIPTNTRVPPTSIQCGRTKMPHNLPNASHIGAIRDFFMGPKWDFDTFAPTIKMGPVWENPDTHTASRLQPTWVLCVQTKMYPHRSLDGEPICTHIFPKATKYGPMSNFYMGPKWDFHTICAQHSHGSGVEKP